MEIWSTIAQWSPGVAFGMACLYFFNFIVTKFLEEKAEWIATQQRQIDRYDTRLVEVVAALRDAANQDHALRGKMQEISLRGETQFMTILELLRTIDGRLRGKGDD